METTLYYTFSTVAQVFAALLGFAFAYYIFLIPKLKTEINNSIEKIIEILRIVSSNELIKNNTIDLHSINESFSYIATSYQLDNFDGLNKEFIEVNKLLEKYDQNIDFFYNFHVPIIIKTSIVSKNFKTIFLKKKYFTTLFYSSSILIILCILGLNETQKIVLNEVMWSICQISIISLSIINIALLFLLSDILEPTKHNSISE